MLRDRRLLYEIYRTFGISRLDYLSLNVPECNNHSVNRRIKLRSYFDASKFSRYQEKRILKFVQWLDLDDASFNNVLCVFRREELFPFISSAFLSNKKYWFEGIIRILCNYICCRNDCPVRHFVFLNLLEVLGYFKFLSQISKQTLVDEFLQTVTDDDYYLAIIIKMKKVFFNKLEHRNIVFRNQIIKLASLQKSDDWFEMFQYDHFRFPPSEYFLEPEKHVFFLLFRYGYTNEFSAESLGQLRTIIMQYREKATYLKYIVEKEMYPEIAFRVFQVILVYEMKNKIYSASQLKFLWKIVTDPYLVKTDFLPSPEVLARALPGAREQYLEIYKWYVNSVHPETSHKTPRSLQHLSRCKIRRCLGINFRLPEGIFDLMVTRNGTSREKPNPLPYKLQKYLLLEDDMLLRSSSLKS